MYCENHRSPAKTFLGGFIKYSCRHNCDRPRKTIRVLILYSFYTTFKQIIINKLINKLFYIEIYICRVLFTFKIVFFCDTSTKRVGLLKHEPKASAVGQFGKHFFRMGIVHYFSYGPSKF